MPNPAQRATPPPGRTTGKPRAPRQTGAPWVAGVLAAALLAAGCGEGGPRFAPDALLRGALGLSGAQRDRVDAALAGLFGTPDTPRIPLAAAGLLDAGLLEQAAGPVASYTAGVTHGLYRRHCARCHGVTGDGRGPTALHQWPYPRDFRQGVFKWKSTYRDARPTEADLHAALERGAPGTAMPSFRLLEESERRALVHYVKYLALRGELEAALTRRVAEEPPAEEADAPDADLDNVAEDLLGPIVEAWAGAEARVVPVGEGLPEDARELAAWVDEGRTLFHDAQRAGCVQCHGEAGRGAAEPKREHDVWSARVAGFAAETDRLAAQLETLRVQRPAGAEGPAADAFAKQAAAVAARVAVARDALPARLAEPRRLLWGRLRGDPSPGGVFRRIHQGVAGTPMPAVGAVGPGAVGALSDDEVWRITAYVLSLTRPPAEAAE